MGVFDSFFKRETSRTSSRTIKIGDWVTQYSAGYWQVVNIFPKYAQEDYSYNGKTWRRGDCLGDWMILKKGFTAKMKPSNACEFVDALWCKLVSNDTLQSIQTIFAENPKVKEKYEKAPCLPKPSVTSIWLALTEEQAASFSEHKNKLPDKFTSKQFWTCFSAYRQNTVDPSDATHILHLYSYLWEIDENFEPLHFGPELRTV